MLVFGHTGITLGVSALLAGALGSSPLSKIKRNEAIAPPSHYSQVVSNRKAPWLAFLEKIDIRLLLIGSLLPDIIDKPVGQLLFKDTFSNGRIFSHTILFLLILILTGLYLYRSREKPWLLVLGFGTFTHLICDQMWLTPQTLFWPIYGFTFARADLTHWTQNVSHALLTDPSVYVPEIIGAVILVAFLTTLVLREKVYLFIRNGQFL